MNAERADAYTSADLKAIPPDDLDALERLMVAAMSAATAPVTPHEVWFLVVVRKTREAGMAGVLAAGPDLRARYLRFLEAEPHATAERFLETLEQLVLDGHLEVRQLGDDGPTELRDAVPGAWLWKEAAP